MSQKERSILRVEGKEDHHTIRHLLKRHGVDPLSVDIKGAEQEDASDKNKLLTGMKAEVMTSNDKAIGFVLGVSSGALTRNKVAISRLNCSGIC